MSRRQAREIALQALFQLDYNKCSVNEALTSVILEAEEGIGKKIAMPTTEFATELTNGTIENLEAIDNLLNEHSKDWKVDRMSGIDRNIVRLAIYEIKFSSNKLVPSIPINEAIELAKKFGTDDSARFVNGILGSMIK